MKIYIETLGCSKNLVDSEMMMGLLEGAGHVLAPRAELADAVVVNTCSFIHDAKEESVTEVLEMAALKEAGEIRYLLMAGCLSERYPGELFEEMPEVDAFVGTTHFDDIVEVIRRVQEGQRVLATGDVDRELPEKLPRVQTTPQHFAYVKIAEGCDNRCTYCIIPKLRGAYRSRSIEAIVEEVRELVENGVVEVNLISQDSSRYGLDRYGEPSLARLLASLNAIEGLHWIRVQYLYPDIVDEAMIQAIRDCEKCVPYFDIPIQHASDRVLKRMHRHTSQADVIALIENIRKILPEAVIRTTLIAGFPGETEEDHQVMKAFLEEQALDKVGVFSYSDEEDTPAFKLDGKLPGEIKDRRRDELMEIQMHISEKKQWQAVGTTQRVLVEEVAAEDVYVGRTATNAPEVDGVVYVHTKDPLHLGAFVDVTITDALEYDLIGEIADELSQ